MQRRWPEAAALFAGLTELQVRSLASLDPVPGLWTNHLLDGVDAEWFPPRTEHTNDLSGCDIACCLALEDGRRALVTIEVKDTDTFSPNPVTWSRYELHLTALGLDRAATAALVKAGCSQVLRQVMITDSVRRRGLASGVGPNGQVDVGLAVVLARQYDKVAQRVVQALDEAVGTRIPVRFWSHRHLFTEAAKVAGLREWAEAMTARYVPDGSDQRLGQAPQATAAVAAERLTPSSARNAARRLRIAEDHNSRSRWHWAAGFSHEPVSARSAGDPPDRDGHLG